MRCLLFHSLETRVVILGKGGQTVTFDVYRSLLKQSRCPWKQYDRSAVMFQKWEEETIIIIVSGVLLLVLVGEPQEPSLR